MLQLFAGILFIQSLKNQKFLSSLEKIPEVTKHIHRTQPPIG